MRFSVIGAGSWGTTLANLLCLNGHKVILWAREPEIVSGIMQNRRNPYFVKELQISSELFVTNQLDEALTESEVLVFSVPSAHLRGVAKNVRTLLPKIKPLVNTAKGLELESGLRLSQVLQEEFGVDENSCIDCIGVLSGPNLAPEIAQGKAGAAVIGCPNQEFSKAIQSAFSSSFFRVYRHSDRTGVELGGALKNIFAIGAGIVDGLKLGNNAKAAYLTRSLHEMVRLGTHLGGLSQTFYGLSGLGDLMATSSSPLSRNYQLGMSLTNNQTIESFYAASRMVVEGVPTAQTAFEWGKKLTIPLPITEEICRILFEKKLPNLAIKDLMHRSLKDEEE